MGHWATNDGAAYLIEVWAKECDIGCVKRGAISRSLGRTRWPSNVNASSRLGSTEYLNAVDACTYAESCSVFFVPLQSPPKPRKADFVNLLHKVPPTYIRICCHSSWEKRSEQLT